jgi:arginine repressor
MDKKISLTNFLTDLRVRNYTIFSQEEIVENLNDRGFETSVVEVGEMFRNLERLSYVKKASKSDSGFRMVNATSSISFSGCVWCGATATPNYEERKVIFETKTGYQETKLVALNTDRVCKSCSVSEEFVEEEGDLYGEK